MPASLTPADNPYGKYAKFAHFKSYYSLINPLPFVYPFTLSFTHTSYLGTIYLVLKTPKALAFGP